MRFPTMRGVIDRRILANFHVDPEVLRRELPAPFRPRIVHGRAMVGICLIRLRALRPAFLPSWLGVSSENAAHRAAVEWDTPDGPRQGVFIRRRDTNSRMNTWLGGRLFPGLHHHATFAVEETDERLFVSLQSDDGDMHIAVRGHCTDRWPPSSVSPSSVFASLAEASDFFAAGSMGYSTTADAQRFDGLELHCRNWTAEPLAIDEIHSSYFDNRAIFPPGSIEFDCALLMRQIDHEWETRDALCCAAVV